MNHSPRQNSGFTLLELLTATAIASLLVVMLISVFNQANKAWVTGEEQAEVYQMGRAVMDLMARDLAQVRVAPRCAFTGQADQISFFAAVSEKSNRSDLDLVQYSYSLAGSSLARTNTPLNTASPVGGALLSSNLIRFAVRYWTNSPQHRLTPAAGVTTYNSTTTTNAPVAVEVTLGLLPTRRADAYWRSAGARVNITNTYMRTFTQMIYLPDSKP
jgi:prepilin-type N-terminal cleavage/methylation domain-containing protein